MTFDLQVALVLEARDATAATAARDEVIGALGHPVTERLPVEESTKFPDCWLTVMNLTPFDDDPVDVITRLGARLAVAGSGAVGEYRGFSTACGSGAGRGRGACARGTGSRAQQWPVV